MHAHTQQTQAYSLLIFGRLDLEGALCMALHVPLIMLICQCIFQTEKLKIL